MTTDLAHEVQRTQNFELYFKLSQYMLVHRITQADKFVDSDLAMLLASCMHNAVQEQQAKT